MRWGAAVSSGTGGLHLAVRALGVGPEDCVVTSSFSFVASANCVRYEGGEPVFVDVDEATLCLDPDAVAEYLDTCDERNGAFHDPVSGRRVAAILPVDVFGHPADLMRLRAVAESFASSSSLAQSPSAVASRPRPDVSSVDANLATTPARSSSHCQNDCVRFVGTPARATSAVFEDSQLSTAA